MSRESNCRCLLCGMERHLDGKFTTARGLDTYRQYIRFSPALSTFLSARDLITYLHTDDQVNNGHHSKDQILAELLGSVTANRNAATARDLLLLAFVPMLHSVSRNIATRSPALPADDIAQHVVTVFLGILRSAEFSGRDSHIAFAIARLLRRNAFTWAERECRGWAHGSTGDGISEVSVQDSCQPIERAALLRHFLARCHERGVLSRAELELLVQSKLDDPHNADYSNASRQRMKRLLGKLRREAQRRNQLRRADLQLRLF